MNQHLKHILDFIEGANHLSEDEKSALLKSIKNTENELAIAQFKLERTEKVKRTTAILLEETIEELEQKRKSIEETNQALNNSLNELKATQAQLIHSEKMASLGELTAGIAHEIQNPLNFVNNFSEVSEELVSELKEELNKGDVEEAKVITDNVIQNLRKIHQHGQRASNIVKGMLQHSSSSSGEKESTDINKLADEYLRLAYHGLRAKDKSFNASLETDFDKSIEKLMVVPQDIGRVLLNIINNSLFAIKEKQTKMGDSTYRPTIWVSTKKEKDRIAIRIKDNGMGIPESVKKKIFQPFFTTKPTGQGTGLGLSLAYDIVKAHRGEISIESTEGSKTVFIIILPFLT